MQRWLHAGEQPRKRGAALLERYAAEIPIAFAQNIKEDDRGRHLLGEQPHPRFCRVKAQLQRLEIEHAGAHNHDLAVEHAALRQLHPQRLDQLRVVAAERLLIAALDEDLVRITKNQCPEAIPLWLEEPPLAIRQSVGRFGEHRQDRRVDGEMHDCVPRGRKCENRLARDAGVSRDGTIGQRVRSFDVFP